MTEHQPDRIWSGIDIPKTVAGVLAAISAAVVGSYLGVAGTLAGAAVASVIGSVGTEIYTRSIHKGKQKLQGTFTAAPAAVGTPPVAAAAATTIALPAMDAATPRKVRWKRVALVAGALFMLAIGTLTTAELLSGRSIADATRGGNGDRSTISSLFSDKSGKNEKPDKSGTSTPSESPSTQPTESPTEQPTQQPTDQPTDQPTTAPTGNSDTTAPATGNPDSTGGTGNGGTGTGTGGTGTGGTGTGTGGNGGAGTTGNGTGGTGGGTGGGATGNGVTGDSGATQAPAGIAGSAQR